MLTEWGRFPPQATYGSGAGSLLTEGAAAAGTPPADKRRNSTVFIQFERKEEKKLFFSRHLEKDLEKRKCIIHCRIEGWVTEGDNKVEICINSFWIFY